MEQDKEITAVVFRVFRKGGDVLALFPQLDTGQGYCSCYQHIGQHGSADYTTCMQLTRPAKPAEYADLKRELERAPYGYRLKAYARRPAR